MPKSAPMFRQVGGPPGEKVKGKGDGLVHRRPSARARGYSAAWDKASLAHLGEHPLCVGCAAVGITCAAELVDHIEPHQGDMVLFWNVGNWQSACAWHHDRIKQELERRWKAGEATAADLKLDSEMAKQLTRESDSRVLP